MRQISVMLSLVKDRICYLASSIILVCRWDVGTWYIGTLVYLLKTHHNIYYLSIVYTNVLPMYHLKRTNVPSAFTCI